MRLYTTLLVTGNVDDLTVINKLKCTLDVSWSVSLEIQAV
jgi:hypothetical protein